MAKTKKETKSNKKITKTTKKIKAAKISVKPVRSNEEKTLKSENQYNNYSKTSISNEYSTSNDNKEKICIKHILGMIFFVIGYIGVFWIGFRALVLEWLYIRESFWNMVNPFIHFKVLWHLLHDLDIYAVISCFGIGFLLLKWAEKDKNKPKIISKEKELKEQESNKKWRTISLIIIAIMIMKAIPRVSSMIKMTKHKDYSYTQTVSSKKITIDDVIKLGCLSEEDFANYLISPSFSREEKGLDYFIQRYNKALPNCPELNAYNVWIHLDMLSESKDKKI